MMARLWKTMRNPLTPYLMHMYNNVWALDLHAIVSLVQSTQPDWQNEEVDPLRYNNKLKNKKEKPKIKIQARRNLRIKNKGEQAKVSDDTQGEAHKEKTSIDFDQWWYKEGWS